MRLLADENVKPAHVSALDSAGHDIVRIKDVLEKGATDEEVLAVATDEGRIVVTYDRADFASATGHAGVLIAVERMQPRALRRGVERIERAYPALDGVVEFVPDWA